MTAARRPLVAAGSLRLRIATGLLVAFVLLAGTGAFTYGSLDSALQLERQSKAADAVEQDNLSLTLAMVNEETGIRGYLASADTAFLEPYALGQRQADEALGKLRRDIPGELRPLLEGVAGAKAAWEDWARGRRAAVDAAGSWLVDAASDEQGKTLFDGFRAADGRLSERISSLSSSLVDRASQRERRAPFWLLAGYAGMALILLGVALRLTTSVFRPVLALSRAAERLAEGEATAVPGAERRDEIGGLARALASWRESEAMRRTVIEQAPLGILRMGVDGAVLSANPAIRSLLGYSEGEMLRLNTRDLTDEEDAALNSRLYEQTALGEREGFTLEKRYVRKDGSRFWGELTVAAVRDPQGRLDYFIAMVEDISVRKEKAARAAEIQQDLLPREAPPLSGYELAGCCLPAEEVGGDFFDWYPSRSGELTFTLGDVMGKGMPAAILMATVRAALRAGAALGSLGESMRGTAGSIGLDLERSDFL